MKSSYAVVKQFTELHDLDHNTRDQYSRMKFGCDTSAAALGRELADTIWKQYCEVLLTNECVVIPSPYNFVPNAATVMSQYVVKRLNHHLVQANGHVVGLTTIQRRVTYTMDYGKVDQNTREALLSQDQFYFNTEYLAGKFIIFVDDVKITGTHERRIEQELSRLQLPNSRMYAYFAQYLGDRPSVESHLNFSSIRSAVDYVQMLYDSANHVIVRPIKILLSCADLPSELSKIPLRRIEEVVDGAYGEGYHRIPAFQQNLNKLASMLEKS